MLTGVELILNIQSWERVGVEQCWEGSSQITQKVWPEKTLFHCSLARMPCSPEHSSWMKVSVPQNHSLSGGGKLQGYGKNVRKKHGPTAKLTLSHTWIAQLFKIFLHEIYRGNSLKFSHSQNIFIFSQKLVQLCSVTCNIYTFHLSCA